MADLAKHEIKIDQDVYYVHNFITLRLDQKCRQVVNIRFYTEIFFTERIFLRAEGLGVRKPNPSLDLPPYSPAIRPRS
jgi:hypothetical protein